MSEKISGPDRYNLNRNHRLNFLGGKAGLLLFTELCICYKIFGSYLPCLVFLNFVVTVSTFRKIVDDILNGAFWNVQISSYLL